MPKKLCIVDSEFDYYYDAQSFCKSNCLSGLFKVESEIDKIALESAILTSNGLYWIDGNYNTRDSKWYYYETNKIVYGGLPSFRDPDNGDCMLLLTSENGVQYFGMECEVLQIKYVCEFYGTRTESDMGN